MKYLKAMNTYCMFKSVFEDLPQSCPLNLGGPGPAL
jgi:hypothetical protein